jgi:hypothetical protein
MIRDHFLNAEACYNLAEAYFSLAEDFAPKAGNFKQF